MAFRAEGGSRGGPPQCASGQRPIRHAARHEDPSGRGSRRSGHGPRGLRRRRLDRRSGGRRRHRRRSRSPAVSGRRPHWLHRCAGPRPGAGWPSVSSASAGSPMRPEARMPPRQRSWSRSASPSARGSRRSPTRRCGVRTAEGDHGPGSAEGTAGVALGRGDRERRPSHAPPGLVPRARRAPATEAAPRRPVRTADSVPFVSFGEKRPGRRARLLRSRRARADHRVPADGSERESPLTGRSAGPPR